MSGVLVVFYTRNGYSEKIAHDAATILNARIDEIKDEKKYKGCSGFIKSRFNAYFDKTTEIEYEIDPSEFISVIIVSPVWSKKMPPAIRTYIMKNIDKMKNYGFIINCNDDIDKRVFRNFRFLLKESIAEYGVNNAEIDSEFYYKYLEDFADRFRVVMDKGEKNEG
jgi:flavodoxin